MFRKCVVFIDDDENLLNFLKIALEETDIELHFFKDQATALSQVEELFPGIIFIDYQMPEGDGVKLLSKIHEIIPQSIKIMMTGEGNEMVAVKSLKTGALDYLVKPVDTSLLINLIETYLKQFYSKIINLNDKYVYPLSDPAIARYEFLRAVYSNAAKNIKEACRYFSYSRQDFYNYEKGFKLYGPVGLLKKKVFNVVPKSAVIEKNIDKLMNFEDFIDKNDIVQQKLEMMREAAVSPKPNICEISPKYGFTRESFYQLYQRFQTEGLGALVEKKKGRPPKQ